jgi:hypothetical protein
MGSRRIEGELWKLGFSLSRRTVQRILRVLGPRARAPRGQSWRTFFSNHWNQLWAFGSPSERANAADADHGVVLVLSARQLPTRRAFPRDHLVPLLRRVLERLQRPRARLPPDSHRVVLLEPRLPLALFAS